MDEIPLPDTAYFKPGNFISDTEAISIGKIDGYGVSVEQHYLYAKQRRDVSGDYYVYREDWYAPYPPGDEIEGFDKIESAVVTRSIQNRTLILSAHLKGKAKPPFIDGKENDEYFDHEIHRKIYLDLDDKKITKMEDIK